MTKLGKTIFNKIYYLIILIIFYFFWAIPYLQLNKQIESSISLKIENFALLTIGVAIFLLLLRCKNTKIVIPIVVLTPFVFAHPFDAYTVPLNLYVAVGFVMIGFIVHLIIYREKFNFGRFFMGLAILCLALMLGGMATKAEYFFKQLGFVALCALGLLFFYTFFATTTKIKFVDLARIVTYLGVFILLQVITYYLTQENILDSLLAKEVAVGWGVTNNIGLILLFTFPFSFYLAITNKGIKTSLYTFLSFCQMITIVFTYSRGSIIAMILGLIFLLPVSIKYAQDRWTFLSTFNILLLVVVFAMVYSGYQYPEYFHRFYEYVLKIDLDSINGRIPIYQDIIDTFKQRPVFGYGMFAPFSAGSNIYTWGHSTVLHTLYTAGAFGAGALLFHLGQKYYVLLHQINIQKIIVAFSFSISGLYGLFDVSYYFMNYMIILIVVLATMEQEILIVGK
ncbi:MAG: O-antigen ligase family protein [Bacilli bacterium]|jgi:O-antigen ligase